MERTTDRDGASEQAAACVSPVMVILRRAEKGQFSKVPGISAEASSPFLSAIYSLFIVPLFPIPILKSNSSPARPPARHPRLERESRGMVNEGEQIACGATATSYTLIPPSRNASVHFCT